MACSAVSRDAAAPTWLGTTARYMTAYAHDNRRVGHPDPVVVREGPAEPGQGRARR